MDGFEGLLATVLGKIAQQDFRLAKSGLQNGKDGETLASTNHISFEGKLYKTKINDNEVLTKITRIIGSSAPPDVWVLGATVEASTQLLEPMQSAAEKSGIGMLVLDWPNASAVPPLAAACAMAHEETISFMKDYSSDLLCLQKVEAALKSIRSTEAFAQSADRIRRALQEPTLGIANARAANRKWLEEAFAERPRAKAVFGQILAPNASGPLPLRARNALVEKVQLLLAAPPSRKVIALVGGEGHGKSWLFAQSWLTLDERMLTVVIPATELKPVTAYGSFASFFITWLIQQSGDSDTEHTRKRWEKRLSHWKDQPNGTTPRFIVCVDGLNQQPGFGWSRWLDGAANVIEDLGGVLVVTARETYFHNRVRTALHSKIETIHVPEWTAVELREILSAKGVDHAKVSPIVFARIQNPRILAIAFDLLDNVQIQNFTELSVERLLFEHIRISDRDGNAPEPPDQFSKRLAQHAQEIIDRVKQQKHEDRLIFDRALGVGQGEHYELTTDLLAVTAEHFFKPLPEDPTLYTLSDEGLSLALGLSIIRALQKAERNDRNVTDALEALVEPIAALDKTADAVLSGVLVASIDDKCSLEIRHALICGYVRLQNIDANNYPAFVAVVRNATDAAMQALVELSTSSLYTANKDWLSSAIRECRQNSECWAIISKYVSDWLRSYSLDPKIGVMSIPARDSEDMIAKETEKKTKALEQTYEELSSQERQFLDVKMRQHDGLDLAVLTKNAFELLAGMPLADFAESLVACSLSRALNSSYASPYGEFRALIRFNRRDWKETRERLLAGSSFLREEGASRTGKWAFVDILRAITTAEDAVIEEVLIEELTADREKFLSWRLVETYCATDPCDPRSMRPDNIDETARRYEEIKVEEVSKHRGMGTEDYFIRDARPGLVRFAPKAAASTQRKLSQSVVGRTRGELMLALMALEPHSAVLEAGTVSKLLEIAHDLGADRESVSRETSEDWIISQHAILTAFPHLDGNAQIDVLMLLPPHGPPLRDLTEVLKPADPERLEQFLDHAIQSGDHNRELVALVFAHYSGTVLSKGCRDIVGQLVKSEQSSVRSEAMGVIDILKDVDLIKSMMDSGWKASALDPDEHHSEILSGSRLVICAAEHGLIRIEDAFERISPQFFDVAASILGTHVHQPIADRLRRSVAITLDVEFPFSPPIVEQSMGGAASSYNRFEAALTREQARLILDGVTFAAIDAFVLASLGQASELASIFLTLSDNKLSHVRRLAFMLAKCISFHEPVLARSLFERFSGRRPFVNFIYGPSGVSHEAVCIWGSAENEDLDKLRAQRLDRTSTDFDIAQEVLAALRCGKAKFLKSYALKNLGSPEPASNGRALMVIGFGEESAASDEILARHANTKGLIGMAVKAARYAYDRDRWARHWFRKMCETEYAEEYWRFSILFLKIVDGRFFLWEREIQRVGNPANNFEPSIQRQLDSRIKAWKGKREKTFCGDKAPDKIYIDLD